MFGPNWIIFLLLSCSYMGLDNWLSLVFLDNRHTKGVKWYLIVILICVSLMCWEGNGNPLQYSCLENPMDRGAWRATVHEVAKCQTWLSVHAHTHTQMISDTDNLFLYLCVSSLEKLYSDSLSYFNWVHWVFSFLLLSCVSSLYQLMTYFINLIIWMNVC